MLVINDAHLHLLTNHIPVVGIPLIAILLAWGLLGRHDAVIRIALIGAVLMGPLTWLAAWSGHEAEEVVEETPWQSHDRIHEHEELGEKAEWAAYITAALALGALVLSRGSAPRRGAAGVALLGLVGSSVLLAMTSYEGGKIRHDEVHGVAPDAGQEGRPRVPS